MINMVICCGYRKKDNNYYTIKRIYSKRSNDYLKVKKNKCNKKMREDCALAILYGGTCIGTGIATGMSSGTSAPGTVPATIVAGTSCISSYYSYRNYELKKLVIQEILEKRQLLNDN